ncbi:uncharacterized protein LOC125037340 [Penaeus chinensis]|uniref:uncharacterized protein LOC125037340 n=1 Tax=Penaeus chinensis TaxID=139456 RepID=UPI001FB6C841|nr:uncharacterized protein LOC125037340 [Penaeus chinensis]
MRRNQQSVKRYSEGDFVGNIRETRKKGGNVVVVRRGTRSSKSEKGDEKAKRLQQRVIEKRLREKVDISEQQFGFMPGRSTINAIFAQRQLMEKYREDCLTKAVQKAAPWDLMFADDVALNGETNEDVEERLEQRRRELEDRGMKVSWHKTEYLCMGDQDPERAVEMQCFKLNRVQEFKYLGSTEQSDGASDKEVDDVALNGETNEDVEERPEQRRRELEDRGMKVSRHKTEYLCMGDQDPERAVEMQGFKLNRVQEFKYLGSTEQSDGASDKEVGKRIQAGWNAWRKITGLLCDRQVPAKLKGRLFKTNIASVVLMVRSAMLYGMETVAVTKGHERKMEVAEMRMLRFSLGKTRLDRVRNSTIRETIGGIEQLRVEVALDTLGGE